MQDRSSHYALTQTIHALWLQGEADAPPLIRTVLNQWRVLNPDWSVIVYDRNSAMEILSDQPALRLDDMSPAAFSDVLRAKLLLERGGVWVDATLLPHVPLDAWLYEQMGQAQWFAFDRPGDDRLLASWFLAAPPGHLVMEAWWREIVRFWSTPREMRRGQPENPVSSVAPETSGDTYPYYWFHYLFEYLVTTDPIVRDNWQLLPRWSANSPHALDIALQRHPRLARLGLYPGSRAMRALLAAAPVHKLNRRKRYNLRRLIG